MRFRSPGPDPSPLGGLFVTATGHPTAAEVTALQDTLLRAHGLTRRQVPDGFLQVATLRVTAGGLAPDDPELRELLAPFRQATTARPRVRRERGTEPADTSFDERRTRAFVRGLCGFYARLCTPRTSRPRVRTAARDRGRTFLHPGTTERHPRGGPLELRQLPAVEAQAVERALQDDLTHGPAAERRAPLPDRLAGSPATRRRLRRKQDARRALARQLGRSSRPEAQDPRGVRLLPLHEGRKVAKMMRDPVEQLRFLRSLPTTLRHQLVKAARFRPSTKLRQPYADTTLRIVGWFAFLTYCASAGRRAGYSRAVEGLCREALAAAFPRNPDTGEPFDANSLSAWTKALEEFGLVLREQPNRQEAVYRGPTGWALNVYQMPSADELDQLLAALAQAVASDSGPGTSHPGVPGGGTDPPAPSG